MSVPIVPIRPARDIASVHATFRRWLGQDYDIDALDAVLACAAVEQLDGDPVWLLIISGAGNAKTETVAALAGAGAFVESTIKSEGALLSASPRKEHTAGSTGGLLRRIGERGVLVIKDFTSILSMHRDMRDEVLAALREVYDGLWSRNVGTNGGHTLTWQGRLVVIGATTTAFDSAHSVIAKMGDRFVLVRTDSAAVAGRRDAGRQALRNVGDEEAMRAELRDAVEGLLAGIDRAAKPLDEATQDALLDVADLVTLARTAVERDYQGEVIDAHAPEMPTRFAKMLAQIMRGAIAIGVDKDRAHAIALRVAADSMPPLRLAILRHLDGRAPQLTVDVGKALQKPWKTVKRELDALHILGLLTYDEESYVRRDGKESSQWRYQLSGRCDPAVLRSSPEMSVQVLRDLEETFPVTDISGDDHVDCRLCGARLLLHAPGRDTCARCDRAGGTDPHRQNRSSR